MSEVTRQERGQKRRVEVLEATLKVLARSGPRGVTHRAVAAEAGTSVRATTYYFSSREQLLTEALLHYADKAVARFDGLQVPLPERTTDAIDGAAHMLAHTVLSDLEDDRVGLTAEYELVLEIGRNPSLEPAYRSWQARLESILIGYGELFGALNPTRDARLVLAALRGLEIEALSRPSEPANHDDLAAVFRRLLGALFDTDHA